MTDGVDASISYENAKKMLVKGLVPLGESYIAAMVKGMESGWVDVYENEGKTSGGFEWAGYGTYPYVLLNYEDKYAYLSARNGSCNARLLCK